jgi:hypothetical protein
MTQNFKEWLEQFYFKGNLAIIDFEHFEGYVMPSYIYDLHYIAQEKSFVTVDCPVMSNGLKGRGYFNFLSRYINLYTYDELEIS